MNIAEDSSTPFLTDTTDEREEKLKAFVENRAFSKQKRGLHFQWFTLCFVVAFITNTTTYYLASYSRNHNLDRICSRYTSQSITTVLQGANVKYTSIKFNSTFTKETIYRQKASPEVDAAWMALGTDYAPIIVPAEEAERSGIELDRVKVPEKYGGPGYPAVVEATHQVHCLNLLRQSLYFNFDYYQRKGEFAFAGTEPKLRVHIGHCLDNLRQDLMCAGDTGLIPFVWVGNPPHPFPDFMRSHKCRNFEAIRDFAERKQGLLMNNMNVTPHPGALILEDFP